MDPLAVDTITITHVTEGAPDADGVPTTTTSTTTVTGCTVLPITATPSRNEYLTDDTVPTVKAQVVVIAPLGTTAAVGDRVTTTGGPWRVDCAPIDLPDPFGLIGHTEIYLRRWS